MPRLSNPEAHAEMRREQILGEALSVFAEKGFHDTNIADIAQRLGMGHGTFYRYFRNKLDIFHCLLDQVIADVMTVVVEDSATASNSLEEYRVQLDRLAKRLIDVFARDERLLRILFEQGLTVDRESNERIMRMLDLFAASTKLYLDNGVQKGYLRSGLDTEVASHLINAMIVESIRAVGRGENSEAVSSRWANGVIGMMMGGITS